jgi:hypothetical protein
VGGGTVKRETKTHLEALMAKYEQKLLKTKRQEEQVSMKEEEFVSEYLRVEREVIRPGMEEMGEALKERGHDYRIDEVRSDSGERLEDPSIKFRVFPSGIPRAMFREDNTPSVAFMGIRRDMKVRVWESTMLPNRGGHSGGGSILDLEQVKPELVEREGLGLLAQIFDS